MHADNDLLVTDLRASLESPGEVVGDRSQTAPRLTLFHAPNSICSQKVRVILAHHRVDYLSCSLNIFAGETYLPSHVRLRMIGCERIGLLLAASHSGSTSTSTGGCDPAVVPTLVDDDCGAVIVDSKRICFYIDELVAASETLRPPKLRDVIDAELDIVDNLPNYQMLAGRPPGEDRRPTKMRGIDGVDFSSGKVRRCDQYLAEFAGDRLLVAAYNAKRLKEAEAADRLFSAQAMREAYDKARRACAALDRKLAAGGEPWLTGQTLTMADLIWAVELIRMKNLGAAYFWEDGVLPSVHRFLTRAEGLPAIKSAVLDWPGASILSLGSFLPGVGGPPPSRC